MASASTKEIRFIDKKTKQSFRVAWLNDSTVCLESDNGLRILTTISILKTYYEPLVKLTPAEYPEA